MMPLSKRDNTKRSGKFGVLVSSPSPHSPNDPNLHTYCKGPFTRAVALLTTHKAFEFDSDQPITLRIDELRL